MNSFRYRRPRPRWHADPIGAVRASHPAKAGLPTDILTSNYVHRWAKGRLKSSPKVHCLQRTRCLCVVVLRRWSSAPYVPTPYSVSLWISAKSQSAPPTPHAADSPPPGRLSWTRACILWDFFSNLGFLHLGQPHAMPCRTVPWPALLFIDGVPLARAAARRRPHTRKRNSPLFNKSCSLPVPFIFLTSKMLSCPPVYFSALRQTIFLPRPLSSGVDVYLPAKILLPAHSRRTNGSMHLTQPLTGQPYTKGT